MKITYYLFRFAVFSFGLIPFRILYVCSDFLAFLLQNVIKYRKNVVRENLQKAFPDKNKEELKKITKGVYKNLSDIILESIKGMSLKPEKLRKRYKIKNPELLDQCFKEKQSVIALVAHYNNWEWGSSTGNFVNHYCIAFYKPLHNIYIDRYIRKLRSSEDMQIAPGNKIHRVFSETQKKPSLTYLIADQTPSNPRRCVWTKFLNQDTACFRGAEYYARKYNQPVIYAHTTRLKRGYYEVTFQWIEKNPQATLEGEITKKYMEILEKHIRKHPQNWLWTHRRWKLKRPEDL